MIIMQLVQLIGQSFQNPRVTFWFAALNFIGIYVQVISINHKGEATRTSVAVYSISVILSVGTLLLFLFINKANVLANVQQNVTVFEFE